MPRYVIDLILLFLLLTACSHAKQQGSRPPVTDSLSTSAPAIQTTDADTQQQSQMALYLDSLGLVDVTTIDPTLLVSLMYATPDNFTGKLLYKDLRRAYLHPDAASALVQAQKTLKRLHPSYSLIVYDAARPLSVQQQMWDTVKGTSKKNYVSNPARGGGLHNYGLAVDIGLADSTGNPLPMGTEVDHLGIEAHITNEAQLVKNAIISHQEHSNRLLLRQVMREAGFRTLPSEWWHFNFCSRNEAKLNYKLIR